MINLLKKNWITIVVILVVVVLFKDKIFYTQIANFQSSSGAGITAEYSASPISLDSASRTKSIAPVQTSEERLVIKDTNLSLLVKDVPESIAKVEETAKSFGGYLVDSYLSKPEESASGHITIRVPESRRTDALNVFKGFAVKIVSESVYGNDVTDEYVDLEARLAVLNKTKVKFEEIMDKAYSVNDLLNVQRELVNLQSQIDNLKGQQKYYEQSAKLSKIVVYLSTDELSLPYAPDNAWRPAVIFKTAVRSLISNLRSLANLVIWIIVYIPILIPALLLFFFLKRKFKN